MGAGAGSWTWATGSPAERAVMVRRHGEYFPRLSDDQICELFDLTADGLQRMRDGDIWRSEYERPSVNYLETPPSPNEERK